MEPIPESSSRPQTSDLRSKEQRRRERRERRAARRQAQQNYAGGGYRDPFTIYGSVYGANMPDLLNSHMPPPPYSTLPHSNSRSSRTSTQPQTNSQQQQPSAAVRSATARARRWRPLPTFTATATDLQRSGFLAGDESDPKSCCGVTVTQTVSIRWFIVMIAFVGICCSIVGTVLGAMKASGREHLTVSLLMIGVGIVLITVSGIAWRLTATDAPSCRAMLGLGGGGCDEDYNNGRFLSRPQVAAGNNCVASNAIAGASGNSVNSRGAQHPYAAMLYSDFPYRPPPPSYQASMQEYRLRLLLLDRQQSGNPPPAAATSANAGASVATIEPPPNYRAHLRNAMLHAMNHSRPPSYRSHISDHPVIESGIVTGTSTSNSSQPLSVSTMTTVQSPMTTSNNSTSNRSSGRTPATHEHVQVAQVHAVPKSPASSDANDQRSSVSDSVQHHQTGPDSVSIVQVQDVAKTDLRYHYLHVVKTSTDNDNESVDYNKEEKRSVVTIVQTSTDNSTDHSPVIVTVSGSTQMTTTMSSDSGSDFSNSDIRASPAEVEILATL